MLLWGVMVMTALQSAARPAPMGNIDYAAFLKSVEKRSLADVMSEAWRCIEAERYDSATAYYSVAASRYSESLNAADKRRCAIANVNMGYIWVAWRMDAAEAYPWLMRARNIAAKSGLDDIETSVISNLGQINFDYNNLPKAVELYEEALGRVLDEHGDRYLGRPMIDFAAAALYDGQSSDLIEMWWRTSAYKMPDDAPLKDYVECMNDAFGRLAAGDAAGAASVMEGSTPLFDVATDRRRYLSLHLLIVARLHMMAGNHQSALEKLREMIGIASRDGYYNLLEKGYADMEACSQQIGDSAGMRRYQYQALHIRDSLFNASRFEVVKDLEVASEFESLHESIRVATMQARKQRQRTLWVSITCTLALLALIGLLYSHRRLKGAYREIFKRNMELSQVVSTQTIAAEADKADNADTPTAASEEARSQMTRILGIFESSDEIFDPNFSVERLAALAGMRPKNVSQVINQVTGKNFNTLLGDYRVREACRILGDAERMQVYTIERVAEEVGYKSRTYFSSIFKNVTGLTPTQFAKEARNNISK